MIDMGGGMAGAGAGMAAGCSYYQSTERADETPTHR